MSFETSTTRLRNTILATCVVAAVGVVLVPYITRWNSHQLAKRLTTRIASSDDNGVKIPLRQLANLGQPAIEPLVAAAASERTTVAAIARQILDEQVARLAVLASRDEASSLSEADALSATLLAAALARHVDQFGPAGKQWTESVALTLIEITDKLPVRHLNNLLADCGQVLAVVPPRGSRNRTVSPSLANQTVDVAPNLAAPAPPMMALTRASEQSLEVLTKNEVGSYQRAETNTNQNGPSLAALPSRSRVQPQGSDLVWTPQEKSLTTPKRLPPGVSKDFAQTQPLQERQGQNEKTVIDVPSPSDMEAYADRIRALSTDALFLKLEEASRYRAGVIRAVLVERGFVQAEIEMRLRIASVGAGERLRLVEFVAELPATAATRTLRWLLEDNSGDVRLRALTALATTRSPDMALIARDLATNDEDPRVAKLASQLIR